MPEKLKKDPRELIGQRVERSFDLARAIEVNEEERTVELAYASDQPIEHWDWHEGRYFLKLSINKKACRTERLDRGLALLLDHDRRQQIGVVKDYSFDSDGVARATVRFSRSAAAEEIFQDVLDGIRTNVSVGFMVREMELESSEKDAPPTYRCDDWEVLELSLVSIPADISVGVGRSQADTDSIPEDSTRKAEEPEKDMPEKEVTDVPQPSPVAAAAARTREFVDFAAQFGDFEDLARDHALEGKSFDDLKVAIKAERAKAPAPEIQAKNPKDSARDQGVQLARTHYRGRLKSFKGEDAHLRAYRSGQWLRAAFLQDEDAQRYCRENGILIRTQTGKENEKGGFLVPDEFENVMIDLRLQYGVFRRFANVVPMSTDTKERPRRTGGLTAYWLGAGDAITESEANWDRVGLVAKKLGALAKWEDEVGEDAVIDMADTLASEIAYAFTSAEDEAGFNGDGTSAYGGITGVRSKLLGLSATRANIAGLQVASGNAWGEIILNDFLGVRGRLPQFARRAGMNRWYCSNFFYENVMVKLALAAGGVTSKEIGGQVIETFLGDPVEITEVMPVAEANDEVACLYGNLAMGSMLGDRRGVTLAMTNAHGTDFAAEIMTIRGTERVDINVHDVGNASATASARLAGPIVGLLTAAS